MPSAIPTAKLIFYIEPTKALDEKLSALIVK